MSAASPPLTLRRGWPSRLVWCLAVIAGFAAAGLAAWAGWFLIARMIIHEGTMLFGSPILGGMFAGSFAVAFGLLALFVAVYAVLTAAVIALESGSGIIALERDGFRTPCFFNAFVPWEAVIEARVIADALVPGVAIGFPFVLVRDRRRIQAGMAPLARAASHVFAWYARWYARQKDSDIGAALDADPNCELLLISIMTDPPGLDEHRIVALIEERKRG